MNDKSQETSTDVWYHLQCSICRHLYRLGEDATIVTTENVLDSAKSYFVLSSGNAPIRKDLVASMIGWADNSLQEGKIKAYKNIQNILKALSEGQIRYWYCKTCNNEDNPFEYPSRWSNIEIASEETTRVAEKLDQQSSEFTEQVATSIKKVDSILNQLKDYVKNAFENRNNKFFALKLPWDRITKLTEEQKKIFEIIDKLITELEIINKAIKISDTDFVTNLNSWAVNITFDVLVEMVNEKQQVCTYGIKVIEGMGNRTLADARFNAGMRKLQSFLNDILVIVRKFKKLNVSKNSFEFFIKTESEFKAMRENVYQYLGEEIPSENRERLFWSNFTSFFNKLFHKR